jgi:hypothetical protein
MRLRHFLSAVLLTSISLAAHADSLIGSTVDVRYAFPTTSTTLTDSGSLTVTPGLAIVSGGNANLTFTSGTEITVTNPGLGPFTSDAFNGFEVGILSGATIEDVVLDPLSDPALATGAVITFSADNPQASPYSALDCWGRLVSSASASCSPPHSQSPGCDQGFTSTL